MINLFKRKNKKEKLLAKVKRNVGFGVKNTQQCQYCKHYAQTFDGDDENLPNGNCKANHNIVVSMCDWCERFEDKNKPCDITFTKWLEENKKYGILPPPMELEQFEKFLIQYLFVKEPQIVMPVSEKQARTEILFDILLMYSSKFKKEWNNYLKVKNEKQL